MNESLIAEAREKAASLAIDYPHLMPTCDCLFKCALALEQADLAAQVESMRGTGEVA